MAADTTYSADQIEQLLRCPICLDRLSSPKILPCQHTFCKSPCLEGLISVGDRKLRCPECRKEHFVPHGGAAGYPTNITITGFLDLPVQDTPRDIPNPQELAAAHESGSEQQCGVCEVHAQTVKCFHCNKFVCEECKRSHTGQLRFDVSRIVDQICRGLPKVSNCIAEVEIKLEVTKQGSERVKGEIRNATEKFTKELRDREKLLCSELDTLVKAEQRSLRRHQENLEIDFATLSSYCDSTKSMLNQNEMTIPEADLVALKSQCSEYMQQIRQTDTETMPEVRQPSFHFDGSSLQTGINNFGRVDIGNADASNGQGDLSGLQDQAGRARWSDVPRVDRLYRQIPTPDQTPQPTPRNDPVVNPVNSHHPLPHLRSDNIFGGSHFVNSHDYTRRADESAHSRSRNSPRSTDYMFRMDTSTDQVQQILQDMAQAESLGNRSITPRRSAPPSYSQQDRERMGGFMGGGGGGGSGGGSFDVSNYSFNQQSSSVSPRVPQSSRRDLLRQFSERNDRASNTLPVPVPIARPIRPVRPADAFLIPIGSGPVTSLRQSTDQPSNQVNQTSDQSTDQNNTSPISNLAAIEERNPTPSADIDTTRGDISDGARQNANNQPIVPTPLNTNPEVVASPIVTPSNTERSAQGRSSGEGAEGGPAPQGRDLSVTLEPIPEQAEGSSQQNTRHSTGGRTVFIDYKTKSRPLFKIGDIRVGSGGHAHGKFRWPRGVAASPSPNERIFVADSSNHRVQIFDGQGQFISCFGSYGAGDGEIDCLAGIAVTSEGQLVIADRYNHRIQIFNNDGSYCRKFGGEGAGDGQLSYPWGIAVDSSNNIYVCDKENHRVQVFDLNGRFVRKFGSLGRNDGQLENPHYLSISPDNKVLISDTNNHRIHVFTTSGRFVRVFGKNGSQSGEFNFPKGIAVDHNGFIIVADSGNNRVQIFRADGRFFCSFGSRGNSDGKFKGVEGLCVTRNGTIMVCDKENHRIQVF